MNTQNSQNVLIDTEVWPKLIFEEWQDTYATLHLWLQIIGKIRYSLSPWVNHSWNATFYITPRGITTSPIPYGKYVFQIDFDFINHELILQSSDAKVEKIGLKARTVAEFYDLVMIKLHKIGVDVDIYKIPNEIMDPIAFDCDQQHHTYDANYVTNFWKVLLQTDRVLKIFRSNFIGKCSPVHLFWGALDLALTRFSGRAAPEHPGGMPNLPDKITREAYSKEVSSCGFWPGGGPIPYPIFYSYAYPQPEGFSEALIKPDAAIFNADMGEFILPYEEVRISDSPDEMLLAFFQSTYDAAANLGAWERSELERTVN